jgi:hypothetical protein
MKSTNANKALFALIIVFSSCQYKSERDMILGNWKNHSIIRNDSTAIEISDNDFLHLDTDSSFHYSISSINKYMNGHWGYDEHTLHLHYLKPDTIRHFEIDVLTKYNLQFHEGDMTFKYTRID